LHPLNIWATFCKQLYNNHSQSSGWNISHLTCELSIFIKYGIPPKPIPIWKHWLLKMHTMHLQNTIKWQVTIIWVKHRLLNVQTGHYKMCVVPPWPFSISADVCLSAVTWPHPNSFDFSQTIDVGTEMLPPLLTMNGKLLTIGVGKVENDPLLTMNLLHP
jgi:hypothetical protein